MDEQTWWNLPLSAAKHQWPLGGAWQSVSAIFIFYIVALDVAHTHYLCNQNLIFLDVAVRQGRRGSHYASVLPLRMDGQQPARRKRTCRPLIFEWAARFLQHSVRDVLLPLAFIPTICSVLAVTTPLDVIFCGTIMLVVLQLDDLLMNTLLTHTKQMDVATQYSVVVTEQQERSMQRELVVTFWSSWILLIAEYFIIVRLLDATLEHPDSANDNIVIIVIIFAVTFCLFIMIDIIARGLLRLYTKRDTTDTSACKDMLCWMVGGLLTRVVCAAIWLMYGIILETFLYTHANEVQFGYGDTKNEFSRRFVDF